MDILFFLLPLHPYSKVYIQYGYQKDCRGKDSSMEKNCLIAEDAVLTGNCILGEDCCIWYSAVLRSEVDAIRCDNKVKVQDCTPGQTEEFANHYSDYIKDWYLKED